MGPHAILFSTRHCSREEGVYNDKQRPLPRRCAEDVLHFRTDSPAIGAVEDLPVSPLDGKASELMEADRSHALLHPELEDRCGARAFADRLASFVSTMFLRESTGGSERVGDAE